MQVAAALTIDDFQQDTAVLANWRWVPVQCYTPAVTYAERACPVRNKIGQPITEQYDTKNRFKATDTAATAAAEQCR